MSDVLACVRHVAFILDRCVEEGECLLWTGGFSHGQVPIVRVPAQFPMRPGAARRSAVQSVARLMYEEAFNEVLRPGWRVWRDCQNFRCVHPLHLRAGTPRKAIEWQYRKGCMELSPAARASVTAARRRQGDLKLSIEAARAIRDAEGQQSAKALALQYDVDPSLIYRIWRGTSWREGAPGASIFLGWMPGASQAAEPPPVGRGRAAHA